MPAAARMMCSSCGRCMTEARFDFPHLLGREHTGKRGILSQPLAFVRPGHQRLANLGHRTCEHFLPLSIATQQRRRILILARPPFEIGAGNVQPLRVLRQPGRNPARQLKAHRVLDFVTHWRKLPRTGRRCARAKSAGSLPQSTANARTPGRRGGRMRPTKTS